MVPIAIAFAAVAGALSRYGLERLIPGGGADGLHYSATLIVNLSGALALGVAMGSLGERFVQQPALRALVTIGFLSSYTTFSALAYQTVALAERGELGRAVAYAGGSLLGGIALAYMGLRAGRLA